MGMTPHNLDPTVSGCARCEHIPDPLPDTGFLYLAPPMIHTSRAIRTDLDKMGLSYTEPYDGIFRVPFERVALGRLCNEFLCNVNALEQQDTKALVLAEDEELVIHHLTRMEPLESLIARTRGEWLFEVLDEGRIHSHFQPIVNAASPGEVFAYECLARGVSESGEIIPPDTMFSIANASDMLFHLDRVCRLAAIDGCREYGLNRPIFVNFNPGTIYNPEHCLKTTLQAIERAGLTPDKVVFEVVESEEIRDIDHLLGILNYYRENGFRVALDDLGAGFSSLNLLTRLRPDFIKLDMELIQGVDKDAYKGVITTNLLTMAKGLGVKTIAEGVENVGEWRWLVDNGADYLQGFLFARPAAPPLSVTVPE